MRFRFIENFHACVFCYVTDDSRDKNVHYKSDVVYLSNILTCSLHVWSQFYQALIEYKITCFTVRFKTSWFRETITLNSNLILLSSSYFSRVILNCLHEHGHSTLNWTSYWTDINTLTSRSIISRIILTVRNESLLVLSVTCGQLHTCSVSVSDVYSTSLSIMDSVSTVYHQINLVVFLREWMNRLIICYIGQSQSNQRMT